MEFFLWEKHHMTTRMLGRVTLLSQKQGHGFIFGEDGCRVYFEKKAPSGLHMHDLFIWKQRGI